MATESTQAGVTLIEVLVALLVLSVGVLGVATLQLNALKHTDSAMRSTHISFIVHDLLERIRANPQANYALVELSHAPTSGNPEIPRDQDLFDFAEQLRRTVGDDVKGSIVMNGARVTVMLDWNDSRALGQGAARQTMTLTSVTTAERGAHP